MNRSPSSTPRTWYACRPFLSGAGFLGFLIAASLTLAPRLSPGADAPAADAPQPAAAAAAAAAVVTPAATDSELPAVDAPKATNGANSPDSKMPPVTQAPPSPNERDRASRRSIRRDAASSNTRSTDRTNRRDRGGDTSGTSGPPATAGASGTDFTSFKIIADRNIFNPNRSRGGGRADREPQKKAAQVDIVTLVGTLSYSKGDFAFFDGSSSQYRKTLSAGDSIAGYSIQSITNNRIQIESAGKTVEFQVGSQLRREDEGEWKIVARSDGPSSSPSSASTSTSKSGSPSDPAANDILQRLMKKREQEK